jgi:hypothetical protein
VVARPRDDGTKDGRQRRPGVISVVVVVVECGPSGETHVLVKLVDLTVDDLLNLLNERVIQDLVLGLLGLSLSLRHCEIASWSGGCGFDGSVGKMAV